MMLTMIFKYLAGTFIAATLGYSIYVILVKVLAVDISEESGKLIFIVLIIVSALITSYVVDKKFNKNRGVNHYIKKK